MAGAMDDPQAAGTALPELIERIAQHAGISDDAAKTALDAVLGFLRERAPAPIAAQLESYLTGESGGASVGAAAKGALGGLFGKRDTD